LLYVDRKAHWITCVCLYISFWLNAACGYVGDPLPPLIQIPERISDLAAAQLGRSIKLSWTLPKLNTDGSAATTLSRVEIYRLRERSDPVATLDSKHFSEHAVKWMVLNKVNFDAYQEGDRIVLSDSLQDLDTSEVLQSMFAYAIRVLNNKKQDAGFSNLVSARVYLAPNPPDSIRFSFGEEFIKLSWQPPILNIDGSPVTESVKYNVYRATIHQARVRERLTSVAVSQNEFQDTTMALGQVYFYTVRAAIDSKEGVVESFDSKEYEAKNVDTYPPRAPAEVTAISDGSSISVVWLPNTEEDLAGYYVYRSGVERDFKRLTPQAIATASFNDRSVEKGNIYHYRVKAMDKMGNESADSEEVSEKVE
jgi:hypothetical protein